VPETLMSGAGATTSFTMSDLVERTGVAATTIHHYQRLGLLPPPERVASNRFRYTEQHVQAVKLIRVLRERRRLPLETIRRVLPELLTHDEHAFRPGMWEQVVTTDAHETLSRERAAVVSSARAAFAERGFAGVSVGDLCDAMGIAKGTFYGLFGSKEEVFLACADAVVADVVRVLAAAPPSGPLSQRQLAALLDRLLAPEALVLVELAVRGAHGRAGDAAAAGQLVAAMEGAVAHRLRPTVAPGTAAMLVDAALGRSLRGLAPRRSGAQ
jgi:AcrR family transcriptional regulator